MLDIASVDARTKPRPSTGPSVTYKPDSSTVTIVGIELAMHGGARGGAGGWWTATADFTAQRGGASEAFTLTWTHRDLIIEQAVLGDAFEVTWSDDNEDLTFRHLGKARGHGNEDCQSLIQGEAIQRGFETIGKAIDIAPTGVVDVALNNGEWIAHCGPQSHRVWFTRKEQPE